MCHFDVVLSKNFLQGFGEGGVVGLGDVEGEVWSLSGGLLRSGRGELRCLRRALSNSMTVPIC